MDDNHISDEELEALFGDDAPPLAVPVHQSGFRTPSGRDLSMYRPTSFIRDRAGASSWIEAIYASAMDALRRQDYAETLRHLKRCLEDNPDFIDALLWLGRLEDDPAVRREHLKHVLALQASNADAMRELMILDGELSADAPFDAFTMPKTRRAGGDVGVKARSLNCPRCGSPNLSDDDASPNILTCDSCGYTVEKAARSDTGQSLTRALIRRRSQEVLWVVGRRTLKCRGCGAERTLTASQMSSECPFCGSRQVIEQDALGTLTQPDSLIPFRVTQQTALEQVRTALRGGFERIKRLFVETRAARIEISGVFLPVWVFDAMVDVTHTYEIVERDSDKGRYMMRMMAGGQRTYTEQISDAALNLPVPAVTQPPPDLVLRAGRYDYAQAVDYQPDYVAQHAAELYTIDFDRASMEARTRVSELMRDKHRRDDGTYRTVSVSSLITQASFRLVLVPVWAATVFERDGDVRLALVNGQSGQVALGKAVKPR